MAAKQKPVARSIDGVTMRPLPKKRKRFGKPSRKQIIVAIIALLVLLGVIILAFKPFKGEDLNNVTVITRKVSQHYQLPTNETPALATVTDSARVQASFAGKVSNGDKVLIYETNKKAIVYRPSIDRIVDVEPVTVSAPASSSDSSTTKIPEKNPFGN